MEMGEKIKYLRTRQGMTLEELGNRVGVGKSTVRKWETGAIANMRRNKIASLAEALNVSPSYLMGWEDEYNTNIDIKNNSGSVSTSFGSDSNDSNTNTYTTNNYYSSPCSKDSAPRSNITSIDLFYEVLMILKDMNDKQLEDMKRYGEFIKAR
jgi:ORF020